MPTLDEIYKQFEDDAKLEYKRCSICGAWMNGISHTRSEKVCAELESLRADYAKLREALKSLVGMIVVAQSNADQQTACLWMSIGNKQGVNEKVETALRVLEETSHAR